MPRWIAITAADLSDRKVAALVTALRTAALGSGQDDPTEEAIADVTARIRAEVDRSNSLDADTTTIPKDLKGLGVRMVLREMQSRLKLALNDDEREEQRQDLRYLERIADGKVGVSTPDTPMTGETQSGGAVEMVNSRERVATRERLKGL